MTPTTTTALKTHVQLAPVVCWVFQRGANAITCEIDVRGNHAYDVRVTPHWDLPSSVIERFDAATAALLRHAEVSRRLRENGWVLTDHVAADHTPAAA